MTKYFIGVLCCLFATYTFAQNQSTGFDQVDQEFNNIGYSVLTSSRYTLTKDSIRVPLTLYGGNHYFLVVFSLGEENHNLQSRLVDADGKLYAKGLDKLDIDLRFMHGKLPLSLVIGIQDPGADKEIMLAQVYKTLTNESNDIRNNDSHKALYTLDGVSKIEKAKQVYIDQISAHLSKAAMQKGFSVASTRALDAKSTERLIPYTFYRENEYLVFAMNEQGNAADFTIVDPARKKKNPFSDSFTTTEERSMMKSTSGAAGMSFVGRNPNLWNFAVRFDEPAAYYGGLKVVVFAYRSKDNISSDPSGNKPEKAYLR